MKGNISVVQRRHNFYDTNSDRSCCMTLTFLCDLTLNSFRRYLLRDPALFLSFRWSTKRIMKNPEGSSLELRVPRGIFANEPLAANVQAPEWTGNTRRAWGLQGSVPRPLGHDPPRARPQGSALSHRHRLQDGIPSLYSFAHRHEGGEWAKHSHRLKQSDVSPCVCVCARVRAH